MAAISDIIPPLGAARVAIVGLGLMGGSLALALRGQAGRLMGVARRPETAARALALGLVDEATTDAQAAARQADVVVLAVPVCAIVQLIADLAPVLRPGVLLLDLGSTKSEIVAAMAALPAGVHAVGGHPMCGKEVSGLDAAEAGLYRDRPFILCPPPNAAPGAVAWAEALARAVGARPVIVDAERHDRLVAAISHLPYLLSASLVAAVAPAAEADPLLPRLAANGFRDTSRLAGSDAVMMRDILVSNRQAVAAALSSSQAWLDEIKRHIEAGDPAAIEAALGRIWQQQKRVRL